MADHHGGGNPLASSGSAIFNGLMGLLGLVLLAGMLLGTATGNAPIRGSVTNVWDIGNFTGAVLNFLFNSGVQTFGDEKYFQNSKKIGSDSKPDQRLMTPSRTPSTILPTSTNNSTQSLDVSATSNSTIAPYQDLNDDGVIDPKEIEAQNKAQKQ